MMKRTACLTMILLAAVATTTAAEPTAHIGKTIPSFELQDYLGAPHSLEDWSDRKATVFVFLGTECPLARLYAPRLAQLAADYEPQGVQVVAIHSNRQDSLAEIAHYARRHKLEFPQLKDPGNKVADLFGAQRTPEVFLLDDQHVVRYWGRIDDQYGVGYARADVGQAFLREALDQLVADQPIAAAAVEPVGCFIGRVKQKESKGDVTYSNQVARILQRNCVNCHRSGQIAPFAMTSYDETVGWADSIREVVEQRRMPPWHASPKHGEFLNDARLTEEEKDLIYRWVDDGAPQGDPNDLPEPPVFAEGWRIPKPDVVYRMDTAFTVPAKGVVEYQYFETGARFDEEVWVQAAEARPGNTAVVHHLILFYIPADSRRIPPEAPLFNVVAGFAPGTPAPVYPTGTARRIPAGSRLVLQVHYTPNGTEQVDVSDAGLVFADPKTVKKEAHMGAVLNFSFRIPPGADNYRTEASHRFGDDMLVHAVLPHMHLRGKSFRFDVAYPDGKEETLLDVPRYDFNWQNAYVFTEPKLFPKGTVLHCTAHYDNSENNPVNPDPTETVTWGDQTWEEMMVGTFDAVLAEQDLTLGRPKITRRDDGQYEVRFQYRPTQPAQAVYLAGSFNEWNPTGEKMDGPDDTGRYAKTIVLDEGSHEYKFVLDGEDWKSDPGNPDRSRRYSNSLLRVGSDN